MAYLDHQEAFDRFKDGVVKGLEGSFPLVGRDRALYLSDITVDSGARHADDLHGQYKAKVSGQTYAAPVYGTVTLKNKLTDQVIDSRKVLLAEIPVLTKRYSYIVDGQEYQVDNQWRLKPGVYTRRKNNGELEAQFNVQGASNFNMVFDPAKKEFSLEYNKSKIPLYPLLSAFGTSDEELKKSWGADILAANKSARGAATALEKFFKADTGRAPANTSEALAQLRTRFAAAKMDAKVNERHLGVATDALNGQTLHLASSRILAVHGGAAEDDRDSLLNKDLYSIGDYAAEKLKASMRVLKTKVDRRLNQADTVRGILKFDSLNQPIKEVFRTQLARSASQVNPLEMLSGHLQTTIMGPGGIRSDQAVTDAAKMVNASHFGYLDPVNTPEGTAGITLRLPLGVKKVGKQPMLPLYSLRTGKIEYVDPQTMVSKKVVLPDQVEWVDGKPKPLHGKVAVFGDDNRKELLAMGDADYVMRHASQAFTATPNILPFVGNNSGPRVQYASKHVEQAISLRDREAPLVQTKTGVGEGTFHELFGHQAAHTTPVSGTIEKVTSADIHVRDGKGVVHKVALYDHFPLNDAKGVLHSEPVVKVGDKVQKDQLLADVNFTKGGALALGTHLRAAYMPYKGLNFEDAAVISESAAKKLTSVHLHKPTIQVEDDFVFNTRKFRIEHPSAFTPAQFEKLDGDGVVKVGQVVHPGDPLIVAMRPFDLKDRAGISAVRKSLSGAHTDASLRWHGETSGTVMGVHRAGKFWKVHVKTLEPMQVGDKISVGGAGAKGIVSEILPDQQMPKNKDGQHAEVLLNTFGVGGRMNPGQLYELLAGKIAQKTGKTYKMENFSGTTADWHERLGKELKEHGLTDTEELTDPKTGKSFGQVLFGPSYVHKLVHQADKKLSARAGMTLPGLGVEEGYDRELQPTSGGHEGGQSIGALGVYALLAHGATSFLRESQTIKSEGPDPQPNAGKAWPSQHREVWSAIQTGRPFPMPKTTFAFQKFISMMKAAGINVEKKGHEFIASPLTDKQVLAFSAGAIKDPGRVVTAKLGKDGLPIPLKGGLFDEQTTGGHGGTRFSHIPLAEPMPNPVYEPAIKSLLGLTGPQYEAVLYGDQGVHPKTGQLVAASEGISGGAGIKHLLSRIDVAKQLEETKTKLKGASTANVDKLLKQAKYLAALQELRMRPEEAYVMHNLPVLPPVMRPISILPSGDLNTADMNELYKAFGQINQKLGDPLLAKSLSDQKKSFMRKDLYGSLSALLGVGVPYADQQHKGLLHQLGGSSPKTSYVQDKLVSRRQDLSMRGVITPEPALGLDEVSLPRVSALTLFRPFLVHQLQVQGTAPNPLEAQKLLAEVHKGKDNPQVWKALDTVMETRPVLLKRDPVLHKYGIQGFKAKAHEGNTIKIHPLICSGFSADFDGDAMAVYVPVTPEAVTDARKMMPSNNLFSEATGKIMYQPSNEAAMGLFRTTMVGETTVRMKFDSPKAVLEQLDKGAIKHTDQVILNGKRTTAGRVLLSERLPAQYHEQVLHDFSFQLNKAGIEKLYTELGTQHRHEFGKWADKVKDLGYDAATGIVRSSILAGPVSIGAHTLSLRDIAPAKGLRDPIFAAAHKQEAAIRADASVPTGDKDRRVVDTWIQADEQVKKQYQAQTDAHSNNLALLWKSGVKPGWAQLKQITLSPTLVMDSKNKVIPTAITKSYTEGLDLAGYWTQMHGARRGAVMKTMEVREPGYLSKLLQNTAMDVQVSKEDCGTTAGVAMSLQEPDISGRYLQAEYKGAGLSLPMGTLLTPALVTKIRTADKGARLLVRSPLKCSLPHGICQKCAGLGAMDQEHPLGTNIGVISAHALGERAVQLPLKSFHGGGTVGSDAKGVNAFTRFQQLTEMPKKIPNAASLAMTSGVVEAVQEDRTGVRVRINGVEHFVGKDASGMALHKPLPDTQGRPQYKQWAGVTVGTKVEAGDHLSDPNRTNVNPHDYFAATKSIDKTRNFLVDEIHGLYSEEGLRRRNIETVVRAMTNLTEVHDPGDHPSALRGERFPLSYVQHLNATELKGKTPIGHTPVLAGVDMLPLEMRSDWMAKLNHQRLSQTLQDAGALAQKSSVHGAHPVPGLMMGNEFGLAKHVKGRPGFEHLKDVPAHQY